MHMNRPTAMLIAAAVTSAVTAAAIAQTPTPAPKPSFQSEKCFGVAKAGRNDCETRNSSCAGTSKRDNQGDAWTYLPVGTCAKIVGGSLAAKV
jgi:uncharacterized membrane protein